jgi:hypothetical protein
VRNFELFREMIRLQKIMSPPFPAGECSLRISVYQSPVAGSEQLSLCLESKVGAGLCSDHYGCLHMQALHKCCTAEALFHASSPLGFGHMWQGLALVYSAMAVGHSRACGEVNFG